MQVTDITREKQPEETVLRLAGYCRVSSKSEDQLHSLVAQIRHYKDYEKSHPEYKLVDIYADEGLTGTDLEKREELNRLIRDCKKGLIDRIITKSVSRFARNTMELLETIRMLKSIGVSVYFEEQGIDTAKLNGEMIVTFPGMAAQQESTSISDNVRWSYKKRMQSGEFNCTAPAYGFNLVKGQLEINEPEAEVIRRIFDLYLKGYGKQAIAQILNDEAVPRRYKQKKWYCFTINYVLNNERYMGDALLQKSYVTETLPHKKMKNNGELPKYYVENTNPAIVSRETYESVQRLQKGRESNRPKRNALHLLNGMMRCPDCGRTFRRQIIHGIPYWICSGQSSGATDCNRRRVREDMVYETFLLMLCKLKDYREELIETIIKDLEEMQNQTSENHGRIAEIDKEIADLAARNLIITRMYNSGILNPADFTAQSTEINNKIKALRSERNKKLAEDESDEMLERLYELNDLMTEYEPTLEMDEELFGSIVKSITVESNAEITFNLIGGIRLTEEINERGRCKTA